MDENKYHFCLTVNNVVVEISGCLGVYNITVTDSTKVEKYRAHLMYDKRYRIGRLTTHGNDDANIGLDYDMRTDEYHMVWPNEDVFKEIIKLIETVKPLMIHISKSMNDCLRIHYE